MTMLVSRPMSIALFVACGVINSSLNQFVRADDAGTGRITGHVKFDKDGSVAAQAKVILLPPPPKGQDAYYGLLPLKETTADADGKFIFNGLPAGNYKVWANLGKQSSRKQARRGAVVKLETDSSAPAPVELRLVDGVSVTVRAIDATTKKLIPKATVHLGWSDLIGDFQSSGNEPVTVQPLTSERWFFEAWADGYGRESRWLNLENGEDAEIEFQLGPGGDIEGTVRDPAGKPVEKVGLSVGSDGSPHQVAYVESDAKGHYRLNNLPSTLSLKLRISKIDWLSQEVPLKITQARKELNLQVTPRPHGGTIVGVVQDNDGQPIADAELKNMGRSSNEIRETKTDAQGRFKLDNLYQGSSGHEVVVRAKTFAPRRVKVEPGTADKPSEVKIKLDLGHRIVGKVTDGTGKGLEGVTVYFGEGSNPFGDGGRGTTDKDGRFEFDALPPNCPFSFYKQGFSEIRDHKLKLDGFDLVTIEMIPSGAILGRVVDRATGKPVRSFNVKITFSPERQPNDPNAGLPSDLVKPGQTFQSDAGKFKLANLVAGMPLQVMIETEGYELKIAKRVVATRADMVEETEFQLESIDPATVRSYHGRLIDADGQPVVGVQLRLIAARDRNSNPKQRNQFPFNWQMIQNGQLAQQAQAVRFLEGTTNKEGRFEFKGVPRKAEVELVWWGGNAVMGRADHLETLGEETSIEITLPAAARISGTINRKEYAKADRIEVVPATEGLDRTTIELKPGQTEFEIKYLGPGKYNVNLMSPYERVAGGGLMSSTLSSKAVELQEGDEKEVDF